MEPRRFDGVLCFGGEDWWYHNRGHYDMQMMRELSAHVPVLYVNSIGMRAPKVAEGTMFFRRVRRKLKSLARGLVRVRENFIVYSPFVVPGKPGMALSQRLLPLQLKRATKILGMRSPLVWVACPPGATAIDALDPVGLVYQRTDRFEAFPGVDGDEIRGYDRRLKDAADVTVFCSGLLYEEEAPGCRKAVFVDHGVDFERFSAAGRARNEPADVAALGRPRVGFVGGIDSHTFDPELFLAVAKALPEAVFVLVGACSLPDGWCRLENVHLLGQKDYAEVADAMAACDVLIMPWNRNEWIKACNPVKLKEYLAVGRPVVSTPFPELAKYDGYVRVGADADAFAAQVRAALADGSDPERLRARVSEESWTSRGERMLAHLAESGLEPMEGERT